MRRNWRQPALCAPGFKSNGIQGGIVPTAAGIALAEKLRQSDRVSTVFIGDGTLGKEWSTRRSTWRLCGSCPFGLFSKTTAGLKARRWALNFAGSMRGPLSTHSNIRYGDLASTDVAPYR